jgi:hypothetical protein
VPFFIAPAAKSCTWLSFFRILLSGNIRKGKRMAIYTPTGLKINIPVNQAFGLMARVFPRVSSFTFLKKVEGMFFMPSLCAFTVTIVLLYQSFPLVYVSIAVFLIYLFIAYLSIFGMYLFPGLLSISTCYSYLGAYSISTITEIAVCIIIAGWKGGLAFTSAKFLAWLVRILLLENLAQKFALYKYKEELGTPEIFFIYAYKIYARKLGISSDIELSQEELKDENWKPVFAHFAKNWPNVAERILRTMKQ